MEHSIVKLSVTWVLTNVGKATKAVVGATPWEAFIIHVPSLVMMTMVDEIMMNMIIMMDVMTL